MLLIETTAKTNIYSDQITSAFKLSGSIPQFVGTFTQLRKATVSFFICLSAWNNMVPTGRIFMIFNVWIFLDNM